MEYFQVRYVIYKHKAFIRLATGSTFKCMIMVSDPFKTLANEAKYLQQYLDVYVLDNNEQKLLQSKQGKCWAGTLVLWLCVWFSLEAVEINFVNALKASVIYFIPPHKHR